ncbi:MAG TPA: GYD domain-containing protein [Hyphomicrobiaceae bacterium]
MATFVVLGRFTDQGIRSVKDTAKRAEAFQQTAKKIGATVKDVYWTLGQYDFVAVCDAPDDAAASALVYSLAARGNVRTQTLRAFSQAEIGAVLGKMV